MGGLGGWTGSVAVTLQGMRGRPAGEERSQPTKPILHPQRTHFIPVLHVWCLAVMMVMICMQADTMPAGPPHLGLCGLGLDRKPLKLHNLCCMSAVTEPPKAPASHLECGAPWFRLLHKPEGSFHPRRQKPSSKSVVCIVGPSHTQHKSLLNRSLLRHPSFTTPQSPGLPP